MKRNFRIIRNSNRTADVYIYEDIGGWFDGLTARRFQEELSKHEADLLRVFINSAGGDVFEGISIYNQLLRHKARVTVEIDGLAASIASVIAMAGDEIYMAENALMMIHDPWGQAIGTERDMVKMAEDLRRVKEQLIPAYSRSSLDPETISRMMTAETWLSAQEAMDYNLIDGLTAEKRMAARLIDLSKFHYKNTPQQLGGPGLNKELSERLAASRRRRRKLSTKGK